MVTSTSRSAPAVAPARFTNPCVEADCPDPTVFRWKDRWYAACTTGNGADVFTIRSSADLIVWDRPTAMFPKKRRPEWATGDFWAPEIRVLAGRLVAYYSARDHSGRLTIAVATANDPRGPWRDHGPFVRSDRVGSIDPAVVRTPDGRHIFYWKEDGNDLRPKVPTMIFAQRLADDGMGLIGARKRILTNDQPWEGDVVEGAGVVWRDPFFYLFYSGNSFTDERYATGVARSLSPFGPFEKADAPILTSSRAWRGPGHGAVIELAGEDWFLYHAWRGERMGHGHPRMLLLDRIRWRDGWPTIGRGVPTGASQATPRMGAAVIVASKRLRRVSAAG